MKFEENRINQQQVFFVFELPISYFSYFSLLFPFKVISKISECSGLISFPFSRASSVGIQTHPPAEVDLIAESRKVCCYYLYLFGILSWAWRSY